MRGSIQENESVWRVLTVIIFEMNNKKCASPFWMRLLSHHNKAMKFFLIIHPIGVDQTINKPWVALEGSQALQL